MRSTLKKKLRIKILEILVPELFEALQEIDDHSMLLEANLDIHLLNLPGLPPVWEEAVANCRALHGPLYTGEITRIDRAKSLAEILERKGLIRRVTNGSQKR